MDGLSCSFFGHRNINITDLIYEELQKFIENLIVTENVKIFLFGSKSDFDFACHKIVTSLKEKYPFIVRKSYTCKHETCTLESKRAYWEDVYKSLGKYGLELLCVEEEVEHPAKYVSGKASYIERNQAMINDSDYCVFYYDENYLPQARKLSKRSIGTYQPKSGTKIAYRYAKQKNKKIINFLDVIKDLLPD